MPRNTRYVLRQGHYENALAMKKAVNIGVKSRPTIHFRKDRSRNTDQSPPLVGAREHCTRSVGVDTAISGSREDVKGLAVQN